MSTQSAPLLLPSWARAWDPAVGHGWSETDTRICPPPNSSGLHWGSRQKGRRKGERKGGKFQEPGLEQNKESVFLPFHQQTSTQKEV